jgi:hypothetical protein
VVPLYSFYYLLSQSEEHVLRLTLCVLLVAVGPEIYQGVTQHMGTTGARVHAWIGGHDYDAGFE